MNFELRYASRREEIWRWYWGAWRRKTWRVHALVLATIVVWVWVLAPAGASLASMGLSALLWSVLAMAVLVGWPQLRFKPQERTLRVDAEGLETWIAGRSGRRKWSQIRSIFEEGGAVVLETVTGNAFVVPDRAFSSPDERASFVAFAKRSVVRSWQARNQP